MSSIHINTTRNVSLDFEQASLGDRILALLLDLFVLGAYALLMNLVILRNLGFYSENYFIFALANLPAFLYQLLMEIFFQGQSLGKMWRKIKVVDLEGREPTAGAYFIRWVTRLIEVEGSMGTIALTAYVLSRKGQRLGDILAGTAVVRIKIQTSLEDTIFRHLDENYEVTFPQASELSGEEAQLIADILSAVREDTGFKSRKLLNKTRFKICTRLGINADMNDRKLLETLLRDYNFLMAG